MAASLSLPKLFRLPNGMRVYGLNRNDTLGVYRDIFEDVCYSKHGVTYRDGDCVLDVGANTGLFVRFLDHLGVKARVYAFEPLPATFGALTRTVEAHKQLSVALFNVGLAKAAGPAEFTFYPRYSQASSMRPDESATGAARNRQYLIDLIPKLYWPLCVPFRWYPRAVQNVIADRILAHQMVKETVTCQLWNLSEFLRDHHIARVDLLKIDAEFAEEEILASLSDEDWGKVRQLIVEVHGGEDSTRAVVELLRQHGFRVRTGTPRSARWRWCTRCATCPPGSGRRTR